MAWYESIYKALMFGSAISFIISNFTTGKNSYNSLISGYSILILGIMMILTILITKILEIQNTSTTMQIILAITMELGPFLLMLAIIGFMLFLIIFYKTPILENNLSPSYGTFSNITLVLILCQLYLIYNNIDSVEFKRDGKLSIITSSMLYLIGVLSLFSVGTLYIILKYFRTDGFQGLQGLQNNSEKIKFNYLL
jgi:hypothetical protein